MGAAPVSASTCVREVPGLILSLISCLRTSSAFQDTEFNGRYYISNIFPFHQWRTKGGGWRGLGGFVPPTPRNSENPSKLCETQPDCENC